MKLAGVVMFALLSAGTAGAEPCKVAQKYVAESLHRMDSVSKVAIDLTAKCLYDGPDDKLVDQLTKDTRAAFADIPVPAEANKCKPTEDVTRVFRMMGQATGIRVGVAWRQCSTKAQAVVTDLRKKGKTEDDIGKVLEPMITAWMDLAHQ